MKTGLTTPIYNLEFILYHLQFPPLTTALPESPDAATGLVYLGGGRLYDPAAGRPLQPNPAAVPPYLEQ